MSQSKNQFSLKDSFKQVEHTQLEGLSIEELKALWRKTLANGLHGLCFSMYEDGQEPGDTITETQVERRIKIIKPYTAWVRSFSCTEGNENVPRLAKKHGLKTMVGAWLGDDKDKNKEEIEGLLKLCNEGLVDIAAVGNEVMYRGDLSEDELLAYIHQVKSETNNVKVGYVDAYYEFSQRPKIAEACDVILANCYPFWEGCPEPYALNHFKQMYSQAKKAGNGKDVIITETGWPSEGGNFEGAKSSERNAMTYFINTQRWAQSEDIGLFYFSSFDESWKVGSEGDVGAYWGLWDKNEHVKF